MIRECFVIMSSQFRISEDFQWSLIDVWPSRVVFNEDEAKSIVKQMKKKNAESRNFGLDDLEYNYSYGYSKCEVHE